MHTLADPERLSEVRNGPKKAQDAPRPNSSFGAIQPILAHFGPFGPRWAKLLSSFSSENGTFSVPTGSGASKNPRIAP